MIELFGGYGSQAMALRNIGANFERYRLVEFDKYAVKSYNAVHGTDFVPTDIREVHVKDLGIVERERETYIMFYSFPCTDISLAGRQLGMKKGSGTRSGLLWEVERILNECIEEDCLPQILIMENVPQIVSKKHIEDFNDWYYALEQMGYQSYYQILNAKDYGIPQNRDRCFMISILGNYNYIFPKKQKLNKVLKDMLVDDKDVPESFFLTPEQIKSLQTTYYHNGGKESLYDSEVVERERESIGTLTSAAQKKYVSYKKNVSIHVVGKSALSNYEQANRIYGDKGLAPTCTAQGEVIKITHE